MRNTCAWHTLFEIVEQAPIPPDLRLVAYDALTTSAEGMGLQAEADVTRQIADALRLRSTLQLEFDSLTRPTASPQKA